MAKTPYYSELQRIMEDKSPAQPTTQTRAEIEAAIADITVRLRGPLSNVERLWLFEDRTALRKQLAAMSAA